MSLSLLKRRVNQLIAENMELKSQIESMKLNVYSCDEDIPEQVFGIVNGRIKFRFEGSVIEF
jgi:hypothetical protein